jgi:hypothetical protein
MVMAWLQSFNGVTDDDMLSVALHPRNQEMSLRDIAGGTAG